MNKKTISILLILVLTTSLIFVGCGSNDSSNNESKETSATGSNEEEAKKEDSNKDSSEPKKVEGGRMIFRVSSDSRVIHPLYGNDRTTLTLVNHIFSPLYYLKGDDVDYWLAEEVKPSDDYLSYTVKLRNNLKWHDGEKITADDLVFTFNTIMDKNQGSHLRDGFITSKGEIKLEKIDDLTVKFILPEVQVGFLDTIGGIRMFPEHVYGGIENIQANDVNNNPIGSGPFKFKERKPGETITLAKFKDFFKGSPHLDEVVYRIIPEASSAEIAFKNGEIDIMGIRAENVEKFDQKANILAFDEDRLDYIIFNQNNEELKNKKLRKAISYALDREEILKATYISTEYAKPAYSFFADKTLYKTDDVEKYKYNPEKAKELLKESGLKDVTLTMAYIGKDDVRELLVQQYLKEVGINVELKAMDMASFYNALFDTEHNTEYDMAFNGYIYGKEPSSYAQVFKTGSMNNVNSYSNPEVDKLWDEAAKETNKEKREQLYKDIQQKIMDDAPMYSVSYGYAIVAANPKFKGLEEAEPAPIHMFNDLSQIYMVE
ncbi:ABC transporter substrate-binding protein [Dethiothermospora halolimnae]|uniref:ABC transporter substrate-binding protein n=1 Tax=Dethiothermospora halolimnae TaxID=3114390 RepID=UPI003CCBD71D